MIVGIYLLAVMMDVYTNRISKLITLNVFVLSTGDGRDLIQKGPAISPPGDSTGRSFKSGSLHAEYTRSNPPRRRVENPLCGRDLSRFR